MRGATAIVGLCVAFAAAACGGDAVDYGAGTCQERWAALAELVEANQACERTEDCRVAGLVRSTCECAPDAYDAVNASVAGEVHQRYLALRDCNLSSCDDYSDNVHAVCVEGICRTRSDYVHCGPPPDDVDAGIDAGTGDAGTDGGPMDAAP